mgnify:FL=1
MEIKKTKHIFATNKNFMKQIYTFILLFALAVTSNFTLLAQEMGQHDVEINSTNKDLSITIGVYNNILYILNAKENEKVDIMNMLGENVLSYLIKSQEERIQLDLKKGFYVVKVNDKVQRIVIK